MIGRTAAFSRIVCNTPPRVHKPNIKPSLQHAINNKTTMLKLLKWFQKTPAAIEDLIKAEKIVVPFMVTPAELRALLYFCKRHGSALKTVVLEPDNISYDQAEYVHAKHEFGKPLTLLLSNSIPVAEYTNDEALTHYTLTFQPAKNHEFTLPPPFTRLKDSNKAIIDRGPNIADVMQHAINAKLDMQSLLAWLQTTPEAQEMLAIPTIIILPWRVTCTELVAFLDTCKKYNSPLKELVLYISGAAEEQLKTVLAHKIGKNIKVKFIVLPPC